MAATRGKPKLREVGASRSAPRQEYRRLPVPTPEGTWAVGVNHDPDRRIPSVTVLRPDQTIAAALWAADLYGSNRADTVETVAEAVAVALSAGWRPAEPPPLRPDASRWRDIVAASREAARAARRE